MVRPLWSWFGWKRKWPLAVQVEEKGGQCSQPGCLYSHASASRKPSLVSFPFVRCLHPAGGVGSFPLGQNLTD